MFNVNSYHEAKANMSVLRQKLHNMQDTTPIHKHILNSNNSLPEI